MTTWIFGYGSLIWRPAFPFSQRQPGYIEGWSRRFWQGSPDHRGTPEAPGCVVTLVPTEVVGARVQATRCWGMAYEVEQDHADRVLARLDHREQAGYERIDVSVATSDGSIDGALCYVATHRNPNWLGPRDIHEIADHIERSKGPSGTNREYAVELARALERLGAADEHVFSIARALGHPINAPVTERALE